MTAALRYIGVVGIAAVVGLWGFSHFAWVSYQARPNVRMVLCKGALRVEQWTPWASATTEWQFIQHPGLKTAWLPQVSVRQPRRLVLPLWLAGAASACILAYGYRPAVLRRKRRRLGLCVRCGYDLRSSSDRCPECNTRFSRHHA